MKKDELRRQILNQIHSPRIPNRVTYAGDWDIHPDADGLQTKAIQNALDELSRQGGGKLVLPAGRYRTGALELKSGVELHLEDPQTRLCFEPRPSEELYPVVFSHWEASPCYNYSALIYACDAHDVAVTGAGVLDGMADADHWWNWHHQVEKAWSKDKTDLQLEDRKQLRRMNQEGVPWAERRFGDGHYLRPSFVQTIHCERVLLQGVTLCNSPMWQLNPVLSTSVIVDGVTLSSHGSNNDGCDPESCSGVWIKHCRFDTGDDCISLKSGRDRDGRAANAPCEDILIEENWFADGHGGIAIGSEMSGGVRRVLACNNHFSSPNLTYALRLKTNARRGGVVEDVILADSTMDTVHGAAVHGTMLYEDGRSGDHLPVFRNLTIENITAHGGDYGIFLEAFDEVPITGLVLRNIFITGADHALHGMNWQNPVLENVCINGKCFPRPEFVRILGVPAPGAVLEPYAAAFGQPLACRWLWQTAREGGPWKDAAQQERFAVPDDGCIKVRLVAEDAQGNRETSAAYWVLPEQKAAFYPEQRLETRGMFDPSLYEKRSAPLTRGVLAQMLAPLARGRFPAHRMPADTQEPAACIAAANDFLPLDEEGRFQPDRTVTRAEMASVAMQACGVNYRNASSTMPVCTDVALVSHNYGTNIARALYFRFMELDQEGRFEPDRLVTIQDAAEILNRVADFVGL